MTSWHCNPCSLINGDYCGPWDDQHEYFSKIKLAHRNCLGFQIGEPKIKGKANWENTEIEKEATIIFNQNIDRWLHGLIADLKGPSDVCLIKDKWKCVNQK